MKIKLVCAYFAFMKYNKLKRQFKKDKEKYDSEIREQLETIKKKKALLDLQHEIYERGEKRLFSTLALLGERAEEHLKSKFKKPRVVKNITIIRDGDMVQNNLK